MPKQASVTYIAVTHYLTSGFVVPLFIGFIGMFILGIILVAMGFDATVLKSNVAYLVFAQVYTIALWAVALYLGVSYSVNYCKKAYILSDIPKIIKEATIIFVFLAGIFIVIDALKFNSDPGYLINFFGTIIRVAIGAYLFNIFSKKAFAKVA